MFQFYRSKLLFLSFLQFLLNFVRVQNNSWKYCDWASLRGGRNSPTIICASVKVLLNKVPLEKVHSSEVNQTSLYDRGSFSACLSFVTDVFHPQSSSSISVFDDIFVSFLQNKAWMFWCSWVYWQTCSFPVQLDWRDPMLEVKRLISCPSVLSLPFIEHWF